MSDCPPRDRLERLLSDGLVDTEFEAIEQHVEDCADCRRTLEDLTDVTHWDLGPVPAVLMTLPGGDLGARADPLAVTFGATGSGNEREARRPPSVAGYEILSELGRGGMGVVYKARAIRLNRTCACKMILAGAHAGPEDVARFMTEAEAIARIQHPNIVQIRQIGEADGLPFVELEYVAGGSLDQELDGIPWPTTRAARLAEQLALGIVEAHRQGIVHRDLKPSNVLLATDHTPKVGDFGLAKMLDSQTGLTRTESVMGSPSYMAPEQAEGRSKDAGAAVDIYAIGAILYELLTGRPPFRGTTALETLEQVKATEPVPPSRLVPGLPRDVETICLKCLQKEPGKRYESVQSLADDLRRFLEGRPIVARRISGAERAWRWCRRNRFVAGMTAIALGAVLVLATGATMAAFTFRAQRDQIRLADRKTRENLFDSLVAQARATRFGRQVGQRFESLAALQRATAIARELELPPEQAEMLRDQAIACMALPDMRKTGREIHRLPGVLLVAFDATMKRYALRFRDGTIQVRNVEDNQEVARFLSRGDRDIFVFCFSPDGRYLASTHAPGLDLTVWDINRQAIVLHDPEPVSGGSAKFSPDSRRIAVTHSNGEVRVYDMASARCVQSWHLPAPAEMTFAPDGAQLAVIYRESKPTWRILDAQSGRQIRSFPLTGGGFLGSVWSPNGTTLALANEDLKIYVYEAGTGSRKGILEGSTNRGINIAFHPASTLLASNGWDRRLRLWDAVMGRPVLNLTADPANVPQFSADGRIVVMLDDRFITYQVEPALEYRSFVDVPEVPLLLVRASIRNDGRVLAVGTDHGVFLWDLATGRKLAFLRIGLAWHLMFEKSGELLTSGPIGVWRWPLHLDIHRSDFRIGPPRQLPFPGSDADVAEDQSGRTVALASFVRADVQTSGRMTQIGPLDDCRSVAVSPDGQWLATGSHTRGAQIWRVRDGAPTADLKSIDDRTAVVFSPDGRWLMTTSPPCRLWAVGTWKEEREIGGNGFCFSPDSRYVVVQEASKVLLLAETETGRTVARLESPDLCDVRWATFSPDGSRLAVTTNDLPAAVHVWDLRVIRKQLAAMGLEWDVPAYPDEDPASPSLPPLPPLQTDLGPLARDLEHFIDAPATLICAMPRN